MGINSASGKAAINEKKSVRAIHPAAYLPAFSLFVMGCVEFLMGGIIPMIAGVLRLTLPAMGRSGGQIDHASFDPHGTLPLPIRFEWASLSLVPMSLGRLDHRLSFFRFLDMKKPSVCTEGLSIGCLAVPYSRMGRPHTTIGATAFHC